MTRGNQNLKIEQMLNKCLFNTNCARVSRTKLMLSGDKLRPNDIHYLRIVILDNEC